MDFSNKLAHLVCMGAVVFVGELAAQELPSVIPLPPIEQGEIRQLSAEKEMPQIMPSAAVLPPIPPRDTPHSIKVEVTTPTANQTQSVEVELPQIVPGQTTGNALLDLATAFDDTEVVVRSSTGLPPLPPRDDQAVESGWSTKPDVENVLVEEVVVLGVSADDKSETIASVPPLLLPAVNVDELDANIEEDENTTTLVLYDPLRPLVKPKGEVVEVAEASVETTSHTLDDKQQKRISELTRRLHRPVGGVSLTKGVQGEKKPDNLAAYATAEFGFIDVWTCWEHQPPCRYTHPFSHQPLYFEDANLERCGMHTGKCQPSVSALKFLGNVVILPYRMLIWNPHECHYSIGDCPSCHEFGFDACMLTPQ